MIVYAENADAVAAAFQNAKDAIDAVKTTAQKKAEADQAAADAVTAMIEALPADPAEASEADAMAAFVAYRVLTDEQKALLGEEVQQKVAAYKYYYEAQYAKAKK